MMTQHSTSAFAAAELILMDEYTQLDFELLEQLEYELHPTPDEQEQEEQDDRIAA